MLVLAACRPATSMATLPPLTPTTTSPTETPVTTSTATTETATEAIPATAVGTVPPSAVELEGAEVSPGFSLIKFADLYRPTGFAFDEQGRLFVTSQDGNVYL